jgi:hypothetical protein
MWLFSVEGFVSIVAHRDEPQSLLVRGRCKADVEAFAAKLGVKVIETPRADYAFRCVAPRDKVAALVHSLVDGINYPNFKNEVAERQGVERESLYHQVWAVVRGLQRRKP